MVLKDLIAESSDLGSDYYGAVYSASKQLYFFACPNVIATQEFASDIRMYHYCKEMNTPAYKGSYQKQPAKWIEKYYIIRGTLNKIEEIQIKKHKGKDE